MEKLVLNENDVVNQYVLLKNIHKVAKHFKVSSTTISRIIKSNGIESVSYTHLTLPTKRIV